MCLNIPGSGRDQIFSELFNVKPSSLFYFAECEKNCAECTEGVCKKCFEPLILIKLDDADRSVCRKKCPLAFKKFVHPKTKAKICEKLGKKQRKGQFCKHNKRMLGWGQGNYMHCILFFLQGGTNCRYNFSLSCILPSLPPPPLIQERTACWEADMMSLQLGKFVTHTSCFRGTQAIAPDAMFQADTFT